MMLRKFDLSFPQENFFYVVKFGSKQNKFLAIGKSSQQGIISLFKKKVPTRRRFVMRIVFLSKVIAFVLRKFPKFKNGSSLKLEPVGSSKN